MCHIFFIYDQTKYNNTSKELSTPKKYYAHRIGVVKVYFKNTCRKLDPFAIRLNFKANMVPWNQIFAQALGFRMNWDDPPDSFHPYHHLNRRDLFRNMEILLDRNGLEGFHCVRRAICESNEIDEPIAIYFKILKIIFRQHSSETAKWHNHTQADCQLSLSTCPFSMLEVSPYTDI